MIADKALADFCNSLELRRGGDTGRRRAEHRNILQLRFTHHKMQDLGYLCMLWYMVFLAGVSKFTTF